MSYYKNLSPLARKQLYEQQKRYRSTKKNMCLVITKSAHAYISKFATYLGWSFTRTLMYGAVMYWFTKSRYELDQIKDFPGDYMFITEGANVHNQD